LPPSGALCLIESFFFQAEDGIRCRTVTGVQTCALPISFTSPLHASVAAIGIMVAAAASTAIQFWFRAQAKRSHFRRRQTASRVRSEERRVGKECRAGWVPDHEIKEGVGAEVGIGVCAGK